MAQLPAKTFRLRRTANRQLATRKELGQPWPTSGRVKIVHVFQSARSGTKCFVSWEDEAVLLVTSAWFNDSWPKKGKTYTVANGRWTHDGHHKEWFLATHNPQQLTRRSSRKQHDR